MKYRLFLAVLSLLVGCKRGDEDLSRLKDDLDKLVQRTEKSIGSLTSNPALVTDAASSEVEKLFIFEYKVLPLSGDKSSKQAELALNQLGKDRWDCFQIVEMEEGPSAFCRRAPKTYLRYIPRFMP